MTSSRRERGRDGTYNGTGLSAEWMDGKMPPLIYRGKSLNFFPKLWSGWGLVECSAGTRNFLCHWSVVICFLPKLWCGWGLVECGANLAFGWGMVTESRVHVEAMDEAVGLSSVVG
jgi:hypothetical protein